MSYADHMRAIRTWCHGFRSHGIKAASLKFESPGALARSLLLRTFFGSESTGLTPDGTTDNADIENAEDNGKGWSRLSLRRRLEGAVWDAQEPVEYYGGVLGTDNEGGLVTVSKMTVYVDHLRCSHR